MASKKKPYLEKADPAVAGELQRLVDAAAERGYYGVAPDPKDPSEYTVSGVLARPPVPEPAGDGLDTQGVTQA